MDKVTETWLNAQKNSTMHTYKTYWAYFLEFVGLTGDQILESRKADKEYSWEKRVMEFKNWLTSQKGQSDNSAKTASATVRGFFTFHRAPLQFRRSESAKLSEAKRKYEDYKFSREDLQKMAEVTDLTEKYVMIAGKSFGLRAGDFLRLTRGDLEPYIEREPPIGIGEKETEKEGVMAYPFIDSDAKPIIKLMIERMDREGRTKPTDKMLSFGDAIQLSRVLRRVAVKAGIKFGNKRIRFHCLRKFLIDRLSSHMSESKWKQIVGKTISEGAYVSAESLREDYARAMSETTFSKPTFEGDIEKQVKKQVLLEMAKNMGLDESQITTLFTVKRAQKRIRSIDHEIAVLERFVKQKRQRKTATNGGEADCDFLQISEGELLARLTAGWKIVSKLQSGEVIVKR